MVKEFCGAGDWAGQAAEEHVDFIFLERELALQFQHRCRGGGERALGAGGFEPGGHTAAAPLLEDPQRLPKRIGGLAGDVELQVEGQQFEAGLRDTADQAQPDGLPDLGCGGALRPGGLVQAADASSEIEFPNRIGRQQGGADLRPVLR